MKNLLIVFITALLVQSCVSNKQIQYFQKDDVNAESVPLDTVLRSYHIPDFEYKIQPHDVLNIRIESTTMEEFDFFNSGKQQQMQGNQLAGGAGAIFGDLVDEQGQIDLVGMGKVPVAGLTIFEVQEQLKSRASKAGLEEPVVNVRLMNFRFTVLGEVNKEGTIVSFNNKVTLAEAIGLAGGLGELADRSKIKLIRYKDGKTQISYINLLDEDFFELDQTFVHQNDVLVVPPLKQRPFRRYLGPNLGLFSATLSSLTTILLLINLFQNTSSP